MPVYVALGSNLDGPATQIEAAFTRLAALPQTRLVLRSRLYRTRPLGPVDQPDFINAAAGLLTRLGPRTLFGKLQQLETDQGRAPPILRWGPRRIDLDLLLYGEDRLDEPDLVIPHPGLTQRNFVLYPLRDIAAELRIPGYGRIADLAARAGPDGLVPHEPK
ncbi:2-amino-4-hydroxy-6-hydroxymethyldihydropteridine diphosphokinase [Steroidobacter denitrificans]|uniref:2-amino-4-hydroxy-6-hydroxymethyldihydropteridine pyrophosphokinase n=1 Tax=Steroidobacter denitrificans TaxID=465721 RepID=A0A127F7E6_STEDE|nr:2-amino-4-hydroxy-6-hydroxymethyldihydropteridine diphosphokinase [Steroidobacter denitrificans]